MSRMATRLAAAGQTALSQTFVRTGKQHVKGSLHCGTEAKTINNLNCYEQEMPDYIL